MNILLIGYGKMGKAIESLAKTRNMDIVHIIDNEAKWDEIPGYPHIDVAIEFSQPEVALKNIERCFQLGIPVVSGTTGWLHAIPKVKEWAASMNGSLLYAPNFSKGVNLVFALNRWLAQQIELHSNYQASMSEFHHQYKLDAPSGTAIKLAEDIISHHSAYNTWHKGTENIPGSIPVESIRNGEIPGTHSILWESEEDSIRIIHTAKSRKMFAVGALDAAAWLIGKKGVFTFEQMLFPMEE